MTSVSVPKIVRSTNFVEKNEMCNADSGVVEYSQRISCTERQWMCPKYRDPAEDEPYDAGVDAVISMKCSESVAIAMCRRTIPSQFKLVLRIALTTPDWLKVLYEWTVWFIFTVR